MKIELTGTPEDLATFWREVAATPAWIKANPALINPAPFVTYGSGGTGNAPVSPATTVSNAAEPTFADTMQQIRDYAAAQRTAERVMAKLDEPNEFFDGKEKYKPGDKVKVVANTCNHDIPLGTICEVGRYCDIADCLDDCEITPINGGRKMWAHPADVEPYVEPYVEPQKTEPVKLYCVKDNRPGMWLTKGKVYAIDENDRITVDSGYRPDGYEYRDNWDVNGEKRQDILFPLVKREPKIGEYILPDGETKPVKVERQCGRDGCLVHADKRHTRPYNRAHMKYLVLDGYTGDRP